MLTVYQVLDQYFCKTLDGEMFSTGTVNKKDYKEFCKEGNKRNYAQLPAPFKTKILTAYQKHQNTFKVPNFC